VLFCVQVEVLMLLAQEEEPQSAAGAREVKALENSLRELEATLSQVRRGHERPFLQAVLGFFALPAVDARSVLRFQSFFAPLPPFVPFLPSRR